MTLGLFNQLTEIVCYKCGTHFAMHDQLYTRRLEDHRGFFCPNGHGQHFTGETEADRLKRELALKQRALDSAQALAAANLDRAKHAEKSHRATKGHMTRIKKRAANGVCPCCNRYFANVHRHMKGVHPDFAVKV
jgi:hypothetical protein